MSAVPSPIRILSVDDHAILRRGVAALVSGQADMSVVAEASNGRKAIQQFRTHQPDVTLMDLQMPEMNGLDAMIAIRGLPRNSPSAKKPSRAKSETSSPNWAPTTEPTPR
jgi:DNA-binding NarL/FixJ family response regulator